MQLDLTQIISGKSAEVEFDFSLVLDSGDYSDFNILRMDPVTCHAKMVRSGKDKLMLSVDYSIDMFFPCDRCLVEVKKTIESSFEKGVYLKKLDNLSDDELSVIGSSLEITELIVEDLYLNIPMQVVCMDDCKGLCPNCGKDLNNESCDCSNDKIDPRLEELKKFFK